MKPTRRPGSPPSTPGDSAGPGGTSPVRITGPADFAAAFPASTVAIERLTTYMETLSLWQRRINLVAPGTLPDAWHRHIADSAQILDLAPPGTRTWVDLGSGAGFPGLVAAILAADRPAPHPHVSLVESDQRKCAFLAEVVRRTGLAASITVDILCMRIESDATRAKLSSADAVSARALAPLDRLLELASPLLAPSGRGIFLKGRGVEAELMAAERSFAFSYELIPSRTEVGAGIVVVHGPAIKRS